MTTYKEAIAFHARGNNHEEFEKDLSLAVELCQDDGYQVTGISHAASYSHGELYDIALYSAVVWCQRDADEEIS